MYSLEPVNKLKSINYGNSLTHTLVWVKSFSLLPLWALFLLPFVAWICQPGGANAIRLGFALYLAGFTVYYVQDLLKLKITFDNDYLYFGLRKLPLKDVVALEVRAPHLIINSTSRFPFKFRLDGLSESDVDILVKHLQTNNSRIETAIVRTALKRFKPVDRKLIETNEKLELPLDAKLPFRQAVETCSKSALKWARVGPVLILLLLFPIWTSALAGAYLIWYQAESIYLEHVGMASLALPPQAAYAYTNPFHVEQFWTIFTAFVVSPLGYGGGFLVCSYLAATLVRLLARPNVAIADARGLKFGVRGALGTLPAQSFNWADLSKLSLIDNQQNFTYIKFESKKGKSYVLDADLIAPEHRSLLLKRLEKFAPECQINQDLAELMLPKSNQSYTEIWLQSLTKSPERAVLDPLTAGQMLADGRFEVIRRIGVGGQGTAYLCKDLHDDREPQVVLKETIVPVFANNATTARELKKFEIEAKILQDLNHPGVVALKQYFVEDHRAYIVIEHVDGLSVLELVKRDGALSEHVVREFAAQMLEILEFLHARGVVHRDFTPDNLLLNNDGRLILIDFNVAQSKENGVTGTIVGKHAYLPPEQFRGKANARSDIYAFGATLFFLLTGRDPEPISQSDPAKAGAQISNGLNDIVKKATCLKEENRFASVVELQAALTGGAADG